MATASAIAPAHAVSVQQPNVVLDNPANWTPHALNGTVYKLLAVGNRVYYGGSFTQVRNADSSTVQNISYLLAVNTTTQHIDTGFHAVLNGTVSSMEAASDGQSFYVGGSFTSVNGTTTHRIARLNAATGAKWAGFNAVDVSSGSVDQIELDGAHLIIGGTFQTVGGATRRGLASINATTGAADSFINVSLAGARVTTTGNTSAVKVVGMDITPDLHRLVITGNFSTVLGVSRDQFAVLTLTTSTATLANWSTTRFKQQCSPSFPTYMRGVEISADGTWFVVVTTGAAFPGTLCDAASRFNFGADGSNKQPTWVNSTGGDTLMSVAITGPAVYVGGHQRWLNNPQGHDSAGPGAVSRPGIAAINPTTGLALSWNPTKTRGVGTEDILATPTGLWIGSDENTVHGEFHGKAAFFPLS